MLRRVLLLAVLVTGASAAPMTYTIMGIGSGSWNSLPFTEASFTFTFTSDPATIVHGTPCCGGLDSTPAGTTATVRVGGFGPAALRGDQAIFLNRAQQTAGIWNFDSQGSLTVTAGQFAGADLTTAIAAATGTALSYVSPISTSTGGQLYFNSVHDVYYSQQPGIVGGPVSAISVTPNNSTVPQDTTQIFTVVLSDPAGASDVGGLDLLIGDAARPYACWIYFDAGANTLAASRRINWSPPAPIGPSGSTLMGDACTVDTTAVKVSNAGNNLSLDLPITFTFADNQQWSIYLAAWNKENVVTNYTLIGTVTPNDGAAPQDLILLVTPQSQAKPAGTRIDYTVAVTDAGEFHQPVTLSADVVPSQSGNTTQLLVSFNPATLAGSGTATMTVLRDSSATPDDYAITVAADSQSILKTRAVSLRLDNSAPATELSPTSGTGATQIFTITWSDNTPMNTMNVLIAPSVDGRNACWIYFDVSGEGADGYPHRLFLAGDDTTSWTDAGDAGFAPWIPGTANASNSQCAIGGNGTSYDSDTGHTNGGNKFGYHTLTLPITFKPAFAGTKSIFIRSSNAAGFDSGYLPKGGWTVQ